MGGHEFIDYFVVWFFYFMASWCKGLLKAVAMTMLGNGELKDEERNGVISIWVLKNGSSTTDVLIQWFYLITLVNGLFNITFFAIFTYWIRWLPGFKNKAVNHSNIDWLLCWLHTGCLGLICLKWRIMSYFCPIKFSNGLNWRALWGVLYWVEIKSVLNRRNGTRPTIWNLIYPPTTLIKMRNETLVFAVLYHFISNPVKTHFNFQRT